MQRIIISVTNDLATDQRVHRVCAALHEEGFDVLLIGRKLTNSLPLSRAYKTQRIKLFFNKGFLFYAEYNTRLFFKLLFINKDILLANDLDTLLPNFLISKFFNKKLVFDSHELFSEVPELVARPRVKKFWSFLEKKMIPKLRNCYTVSDSISKYYSSNYRVDFKVIRNLPIRIEVKTSEDLLPDIQDKKVILYQGAVNVGRGLELMIEAIDFVENAVFIVVGDGDILEQLKSKAQEEKKEDKIRFLGSVSPNKLGSITPKADLGISLEEDLGLNYRYALPNKLFDYIQAEVPVLVSDLPEMKKIIETYDVGLVLSERTPKNLANMIEEMLKKGKASWNPNLKTAAEELVWEKESVKLKELIQNLE